MIPRFRRLRMYRPVTFSGDCTFGEGMVTNISDRGCKVHSHNKPVLDGSSLTLRLSLPGRRAPVKVDEAVVRWSKGREFGLELRRMQPAEQDRLRGFMSTLNP